MRAPAELATPGVFLLRCPSGYMATQQSQRWAFSRDRHEQGRRDVTYRRLVHAPAALRYRPGPPQSRARLAFPGRSEAKLSRPAAPELVQQPRQCDGRAGPGDVAGTYTGRSEGASVRFRITRKRARSTFTGAISGTRDRLRRSSRSGPAGRMPPQSIDARWRGSVRTGAFGCNGRVYGVLKVSQIVSVKSA